MNTTCSSTKTKTKSIPNHDETRQDKENQDRKIVTEQSVISNVYYDTQRDSQIHDPVRVSVECWRPLRVSIKTNGSPHDDDVTL